MGINKSRCKGKWIHSELCQRISKNRMNSGSCQNLNEESWYSKSHFKEEEKKLLTWAWNEVLESNSIRCIQRGPIEKDWKLLSDLKMWRYWYLSVTGKLTERKLDNSGLGIKLKMRTQHCKRCVQKAQMEKIRQNLMMGVWVT